MTPYDFRTVRSGTALPLIEADFVFAVQGASKALVRPQVGISCGPGAILQLTVPANMVELAVVNGVEPASISALFFGPSGWQVGDTKPLRSAAGVQLIRFHVASTLRIVTESPREELYLQAIA